MQQKVNQRIVYFDLLRVLAAFAVILLHVASREFKTFFSRQIGMLQPCIIACLDGECLCLL